MVPLLLASAALAASAWTLEVVEDQAARAAAEAEGTVILGFADDDLLRGWLAALPPPGLLAVRARSPEELRAAMAREGAAAGLYVEPGEGGVRIQKIDPGEFPPGTSAPPLEAPPPPTAPPSPVIWPPVQDIASFSLGNTLGMPAGLGFEARGRLGPVIGEVGMTPFLLYNAAWWRLGARSPAIDLPRTRKGFERDLAFAALAGRTRSVLLIYLYEDRGWTGLAELQYRERTWRHVSGGLNLAFGATLWTESWVGAHGAEPPQTPRWAPALELSTVIEFR